MPDLYLVKPGKAITVGTVALGVKGLCWNCSFTSYLGSVVGLLGLSFLDYKIGTIIQNLSDDLR